MRSTFALVAAFAALAVAAPQGVTANITPTGAAPAGCTANYPNFQISVVNATTATKKSKRADILEIKLVDGILTDSAGRRGYIAANYQFQFDAPPVQTGALYTGGFSVCGNGTLALGDSAIWWECLSGNFYNLYNEDWAPQCEEIFLDTIKVDGSVSVSTAAATTTSDGQVGASTAVSTAVSAVTSSASLISSISDNQPQGPTTATEITSSIQVVTSSAAIVSSISDNQIQAPTSTSAVSSSIIVVSATTSTASVTTSVALVSSISDNQIQAPTTTSAVVSPIAVVNSTTSSIEIYTGAASMPTMAAQFMVAAAGLAAFAL